MRVRRTRLVCTCVYALTGSRWSRKHAERCAVGRHTNAHITVATPCLGVGVALMPVLATRVLHCMAKRRVKDNVSEAEEDMNLE